MLNTFEQKRTGSRNGHPSGQRKWIWLLSSMKCKRFIRAGKLKQDQNGLFELSDEDRDKLTYGEGSFKIDQKTKK